MKAKVFFSACLLMLPFEMACGQTTLLNETFDSGIPASFTTFCNDGMNVRSAYFKNGSPQPEWFASYPGRGQSNTKAVYSCSLRQYEDVATDNWLVTPQLSVASDGTWLAWDAHSVHYRLPESYQVMVSTTGTAPEDFSLLFSVEEEDYEWTHHVLPLAGYEGKNIYLAFVHNSTNKYLLAIDNLFVGEMSEPRFTATDQTFHSCGDYGTAPVNGTFRNDGPQAAVMSVECTLSDGQVLTSVPAEQAMPTGEERAFSFDVPVTLNKGVKYKVEAVLADGQRFELASDSIYCSAYPRTLMMEKLTAYWCSSCPGMDLLIYELEGHFHGQFAEVSVQYPANNGSDPGKLVCNEFLKNLTTPNLPRAYYGRNLQKPQDNVTQTGVIDAAIRRPCNALVTIEEATLQDGKVTVKTKCEFANELDNSTDKYRIGLTLIEKKAVTTSKQANGLTLPTNNEYYFLPSTIDQPLAIFSNVARGTDVAFSGIASSFPAQIEARKSYDVEYSFDIPSGVSDPRAENMAIVAYVLNTASSEAINAAQADITEAEAAAIGKTTAEPACASPVCHMTDGTCMVSFPQGKAGTVRIYSLDGRLVANSPVAKTVHRLALGKTPAGCYLVKTMSDAVSTTAKIVKP